MSAWLLRQGRSASPTLPATHSESTDLPTLCRCTGHCGLVLLLLAVGLWQLGLVTRPAGAMGAPAAANGGNGARGPAESAADAGPPHLRPAVVPWTASAVRIVLPHGSPLARAAVDVGVGAVEYTVGPGDTLGSIAARFAVRAQTIIWANDGLEVSPSVLSPGQRLVVPLADGVYHTVTTGETVAAVAKRYRADPGALLESLGGDLTPDSVLPAGQRVLVPGGVRTYGWRWAPAADAPAEGATGVLLAYPMEGGLSQGYHAGHPAIDLYAPIGTPVCAADDGHVFAVVYLGHDASAGYGRFVIIDHGNGFRTLYAHLDSAIVEPGEDVVRGQQIGTCGNVGRADGPHLHFEVYLNGERVNPLHYLP